MDMTDKVTVATIEHVWELQAEVGRLREKLATAQAEVTCLIEQNARQREGIQKLGEQSAKDQLWIKEIYDLLERTQADNAAVVEVSISFGGYAKEAKQNNTPEYMKEKISYLKP